MVHVLCCSINGIPACSHHQLLSEILREEWGFEGYIVSDQGALEIAIDFHRYFNNTLDAVVGIIKAGCNLELSGRTAVYFRIGRCLKNYFVELVLMFIKYECHRFNSK